MVVTQNHGNGGQRRLLGIPLKLSDTPGEIRTPAPALGQHNEELLRSLGYSLAHIETLRRDAVI
jgi:crotonobetainyl-CoA:carnitine CoA-transferase CaiB-like acyl-CoA transferase